MSRPAKAAIFIVLLLAAAAWPALHYGRKYLLAIVQNEIGLEVDARSLSVTFTRRGPALKLKNVELRDPQTGHQEKAAAVTLAAREGFKILHIHGEGLQTAFYENAKGQFENPVWDILIRALSKPGSGGEPAVKKWDVQFT